MKPKKPIEYPSVGCILCHLRGTKECLQGIEQCTKTALATRTSQIPPLTDTPE